jgi:tRNA-dihydrouridine synthase A
MMDWTDRRCRAFHRILTRRARLYTEMVTADAVVFGPRERLIGFDPSEHPVALQLGGAEPRRLAEAARIGAEFGYDEINLNCGCPSDRVQSGRFGACLMREPQLVAECVAAMAAAVEVPVTVKCRIGVDEQEPRAALFAFADKVKAAGAAALVVHARKAWLEGLSPKDNRSIPPLDYGLVHALKGAHPDWPIILNGGLADLEAARPHLQYLDGIMLGRAAYQNPELLIRVDPVRGRPGPVRPPAAGRRWVRGDRSLRAEDRTRARARRAPAWLHPASAWAVRRPARRSGLSAGACDRGGEARRWARRVARGGQLGLAGASPRGGRVDGAPPRQPCIGMEPVRLPSRPRTGVHPVDLGFLGPWPFRCESPAWRYWILLDFLGFSRSNLDFSMGYAAFSGNNSFSRFTVGSVGLAAVVAALRKGRIVHEASLIWFLFFCKQLRRRTTSFAIDSNCDAGRLARPLQSKSDSL